MNKANKILVLSVVLVTFILGACTQQATPAVAPTTETVAPSTTGGVNGPSGEPIWIAASMPLTGADVYQYDLQCKIEKMAIDEINAKGGVLGRPLKLECMDDAGDPKQGVTVAQAIVDDPKYVVYAGPAYSGVTLAGLPITMAANLPQVTNASNSRITDQGATNIFINSINSSLMGPLAADYLFTTLGAKTVAIVHNKTEWGQGITQEFQARAEELGLNVTSYQGVDVDAPDYSSVLTKIKSEKPDSMYIALYSEAGRFIKQMTALGMKEDVILLGAELDTAEIMSGAGEDLIGAYTVSSAPDRVKMQPKAQAFSDRCKAALGVGPEPWTFYAYDSIYIIADAITRAGSTEKQAVIDALRTTDMDAISMDGFHWNFDSKGRMKEPRTFIWQSKEAGKFEQIDIVEGKYPD